MSEIECWHEHCDYNGICLNCGAKARINLPIPVHESREKLTESKQTDEISNGEWSESARGGEEKPKDWPAWACQKCWCNAGDDCRCACHTSRPVPTPDPQSECNHWKKVGPVGCVMPDGKTVGVYRWLICEDCGAIKRWTVDGESGAYPAEKDAVWSKPSRAQATPDPLEAAIRRHDWLPLAKRLAEKAGVNVHPSKLAMWFEDEMSGEIGKALAHREGK